MDLENVEPDEVSTNLAEVFQQVVLDSKVRCGNDVRDMIDDDDGGGWLYARIVK